jgi:PAS domain S-box-containing protein
MNVAASQAATGIRNALLLRSQREAEARFRALVDVSAQIVWTTDGTGRVIRDSPSWRAFTGQTFEQWKDSGWLDAIHPDDRDRVSGLWRTAVRERTPVHTEYRLRHVSGDWRWTTVRAVPRLDADGSVREWVGMNIDITQQKSAETTQRLLVSELNHRVKNTLASVQAIAQQTLRRAKNPADFVASFGGRIQALARVHTQLTETSWQSADLEKLVRDQLLLVSVEASQLTMSGPTVGLQPQMALHLAMVLHELATNSCKYGSLSQSTGTVSVEWRISDGSLSLKWAESGGPTVSEPAHAGFGTVMVKQSIRAQGGEAHMSWKPGGIQWEISLPLPGLQPLAIPAYVNGGPPDSTALADASLNGGGQTPLKGNRILIVEDEFVIALSISSCLQEVGAVPVGPAYTVEQALRLIESQRLNGALLDANLGGSTVEEIAGALTRYDIPFAFVTGYSRDTLPPRYRHEPVLAKPFNPGQLIGLVRDMLSSAHEAASDVKVALPREATGLGC